MSADAISTDLFVREYTRELHNKNAAVFAGAGLSMGSGYVDWANLLKEIIQDLGLDPTRERDLVTVAQYHINKSGGNRSVQRRDHRSGRHHCSHRTQPNLSAQVTRMPTAAVTRAKR